MMLLCSEELKAKSTKYQQVCKRLNFGRDISCTTFDYFMMLFQLLATFDDD